MGLRQSKKIIFFILIIMPLIMAYQNLAFINWTEASLSPVNEQFRIAHARELLGKKYAGSGAQKAEKIVSLNKVLYREVQSRLDKKYKKYASQIAKAVISESAKRKFDPIFVLAVIETESQFNPKAIGQFGEVGLMQIKPDTAKWIANKYKLKYINQKDLENPKTNIRIGLAYMAYLREEFDSSSVKYVSAYNMGAGNVRKIFSKKTKTSQYSQRVIKNYSQFYASLTKNPDPRLAMN